MHVMIYYSIRDSVDTESQCSEFLLKLVNHGGCILKIKHLKDFDISEESIWHSINSPELISEDTMEYITAAPPSLPFLCHGEKKAIGQRNMMFSFPCIGGNVHLLR